MSSLGGEAGRRRRRWKIAMGSPFAIGIAGMVLGIALGFELAGSVVYLGLATFPVLFVLEAAGAFTFGPVLTGVLYSFSALGLTWGAYYTVLDRRT